MKHKKILAAIVLLGATSMHYAQQNPGINMSYMDKSVRPQDDFYKFVNGTWIKNTEIPADKTRWGSFDELRQNTDKDVLSILNEAMKNGNYASTTDQGKALNLYKTFMDTASRDKQGIKPLLPMLKKIDAIKREAVEKGLSSCS